MFLSLSEPAKGFVFKAGVASQILSIILKKLNTYWYFVFQNREVANSHMWGIFVQDIAYFNVIQWQVIPHWITMNYPIYENASRTRFCNLPNACCMTQTLSHFQNGHDISEHLCNERLHFDPTLAVTRVFSRKLKHRGHFNLTQSVMSATKTRGHHASSHEKDTTWGNSLRLES